MVFKDAAHYYIRKPAKFIELKEELYKAIKLIAETLTCQNKKIS
jgi:hypothetical protein